MVVNDIYCVHLADKNPDINRGYNMRLYIVKSRPMLLTTTNSQCIQNFYVQVAINQLVINLWLNNPVPSDLFGYKLYIPH
jgi:hypothetical protein